MISKAYINEITKSQELPGELRDTITGYFMSAGHPLDSFNDMLDLLREAGYVLTYACVDCGVKDDEEELSWGPCPFQSEIRHDDTPMWLCVDCLKNRAWEI